jgi:uncharacterized protein YjbI with pentapeptide repeats
MEDKLKKFLDDEFKPYGNFPSRKEVELELLANLTEKYQDLKAQGKSDDEAYRVTVGSFGDVSEIMKEVPSAPAQKQEDEDEVSWRKSFRDAFKSAKRSKSKFSMTELKQSDLSGTNLAGQEFGFSSLEGSNFDGSNLTGAKFSAAALKGSTFKGANLTDATFAGSDAQDVCFDNADLTGARFKAVAFKGATFKDVTLDRTAFQHSDLSNASFDGLTFNGTKFEGTSLKDTSFKNAVLNDVSFHHSDVKHTVFDGATMDKVTYALLKGAKANLDNVEVR